MPWRNDERPETHDCRKTLPWLAPWLKEGMRWECGKKLEREGVKAPCGRLWEIVVGPAKDGTADMEKCWREVGGPDTPYAQRLAELDSVDITRRALESQLAAVWLRHVGAPASAAEALESEGELAVLRWTLNELETRGLAKWTHS